MPAASLSTSLSLAGLTVKAHPMHAQAQDSVVAVFPDHQAAEAAVKKLTAAGVAIKAISIVGKGYHTEEKVLGFYNMGDRVRFWGSRGAFWGGLWGLFFGGMFLTLPVTGPVILVGYVAAAVVSAAEGALMVGGLSALGAALFSIGIPKDSVVQYEQAVKTDGYLVVGHGAVDEMARARAIFESNNPARIDLHENLKVQPSGHEHVAAVI